MNVSEISTVSDAIPQTIGRSTPSSQDHFGISIYAGTYRTSPGFTNPSRGLFPSDASAARRPRDKPGMREFFFCWSAQDWAISMKRPPHFAMGAERCQPGSLDSALNGPRRIVTRSRTRIVGDLAVLRKARPSLAPYARGATATTPDVPFPSRQESRPPVSRLSHIPT